jgi:hypothetical protein
LSSCVSSSKLLSKNRASNLAARHDLNLASSPNYSWLSPVVPVPAWHVGNFWPLYYSSGTKFSISAGDG